MSDHRAFDRGIGSILSLFGTAKECPDFEYNGKDLAEESTGEGLSSAWQVMGRLMTEFISKDDFGKA